MLCYLMMIIFIDKLERFIANKLKIFFSQCSTLLKSVLFRSYCSQFYFSQLWCNYLKFPYHQIKLAYNDAFRILHNFPPFSSARNFQVQHNIITFNALLRKSIYCKSLFSLRQFSLKVLFTKMYRVSTQSLDNFKNLLLLQLKLKISEMFK